MSNIIFHPKIQPLPELKPHQYFVNRLTGDVMSVRFEYLLPKNGALWKKITYAEYLVIKARSKHG